MAIKSVLQGKMSKVTAERSAEGRKYSVTYLVETNTQLDGPWEVLELANLPKIGQRFEFGLEFDNFSLLKRKSARMLSSDTEHWWEVTCEYEPYDDKSDDDNPINPEDEPPEVEVGFAQFTKPIQAARFLALNLPQGNVPNLLGPIDNPWLKANELGRIQYSSGEFHDPAEMDDSRMTIRITRNETKCKPEVLRLVNTINVDPIMIRSRGLNMFVSRAEAKMQSIQAQAISRMVDIAGQSVRRDYWRMSYELGYKRSLLGAGAVKLQPGLDPTTTVGWHMAVLDAGFAQAVQPGDDDGRGGVIVADEIQPLNPRVAASLESLDARGGHFSSPQCLDGHGKLLARIPAEGKDKQPFVYSLWQIYQFATFGPLNL